MSAAPEPMSGREALAKLLAGMPPNQVVVAADDPLHDLVDRVVDANGAGRLSVFEAELEKRSDGPELMASILAVDPTAPPLAAVEPPRERFRLLTVDEVMSRPDPEFLIAGHLIVGSLSVLYGPSGAGKTLEAIEEACCIASGTLWLGRESVKAGPVVMIEAEGIGGFGKRIRAWKRHHPDTDLSCLYVIDEPVDFLSDEDVSALVAQLESLPQPPVAVYVDTFARCMTGDENSAKDAGAFIRGADRIRAETGAHVRLIHHTGKSGELERGSSALRAAADTMTYLTEDGDTQLFTCTKQRDAEPFAKLRLKIVAVPEDDSVVLEWVDRGDDATTLTPKTRQALEALDKHFTEEGASASEWLKVAALPDMTYYRAKKLLIEGGYVEQSGKKHVLTSEGRAALTVAQTSATKATTVLPGNSHSSSPPPRSLLPPTTTTRKGGSGGSGSAGGTVADPLDGEDAGGEPL